MTAQLAQLLPGRADMLRSIVHSAPDLTDRLLFRLLPAADAIACCNFPLDPNPSWFTDLKGKGTTC